MKRVWITRDEPHDGPLGRAVRETGLEPMHEPVIERIKRSDAQEELNGLSPDDWVVFTSAFAVECVSHGYVDETRLPRVIAVGAETAAALLERGWRVDEVADGGAAEVFDRLRGRLAEGRIVYPRSSLATAPQSWGGVHVQSPVVYDTVPRVFDRSIIKRAEIAAVASPSAVLAIGRVSLPLASIGPTTTRVIRALGMKPAVEADKPSFDALARAIAET